MSPRRIALVFLLLLALFGIALGQATRLPSPDDRRIPLMTSTAPRG
jgi:hypothetical protein